MVSLEEHSTKIAKSHFMSFNGILGVGLTHAVITSIGNPNSHQILIVLRNKSVYDNNKNQFPKHINGIPIVYRVSTLGSIRNHSLTFSNDYLKSVIKPESALSKSPTSSNPTSIWRPLVDGISSGFYGKVMNSTGTLGCFTKDIEKDDILLVSNNHVFAWNFELGAFPIEHSGKVGDTILQPGAVDGGDNTYEVAKLQQWLTIRSDGNTIDAAYAFLSSPSNITRPSICKWIVGTSAEPVVGMHVKKAGRTTGCVEGVIESIHFSTSVDYSMEHVTGTMSFIAKFDDTVTVVSPHGKSITEPGDSGSMWITTDGNNAVALTFAGDGASVACKATNIEKALGIKFGNV